jgi:hypothetical protein
MFSRDFAIGRAGFSLPRDFGELPDFMERIAERGWRCTDTVRFVSSCDEVALRL